MYFCPTCGNLLQYEMGCGSRNARLFCRVCPYHYVFHDKVKIKIPVQLVKKETEPVVVAEGEPTGQITDATCPTCGHGKAAFEQHQTRSADEASTLFFKCMNRSCGKQWSENP